MPERRLPVRPPLPLWAALLSAVLGGLALTTAFPALSWWPMVFVGIPLALLSLIGRRAGSAFLVGALFGAAFFLVNVLFTARYLGPVPWLALSIFEALLTGAAGITITLAYRWAPRLLPALRWRLAALPVLVAALWTMREQFLGSWPYGGFPWGRVGLTQVSGPLAPAASWVGVSGLSFLIVLLCAVVIELIRTRAFRRPLAVVPAVVLAALLLVAPLFPTTDAGSIRVGAVQGNGPAGYFDTRAAGDVLDAQLAASEALAGERLDLLLWPEGSVDADPSSPTVSAALDRVSESVGAPLLANVPGLARGGQLFNTSFLWQPGQPVTQTYDKRHPVPFGEYVPDRWLYEPLAPDLIGLLQRDYTPGTTPPVMDVAGTRVGLAICFDVIYDDVIWDAIDGGSEVFMFQTNNADFRGTDENLQQLAIARMRAIETGRAVVNISTVGTSQVIAPDGSEVDGLAADTAGAMVTTVPLRTGLTPAIVIGPWLQAVLGWGSLIALALIGTLVRLRRKKAAPEPEGPGAAEGE
ncbi:apolipoprotein N-acyltransferase [Microbacterium sp. SORGH_AS_0888]|uniref:apolipoprotein N-acyltransferase n=1 Tax=Microbacterium sp. SORGH_AS_0888 TaxID=3041791 RepID=UPI0027843621|nr:apolipoprotein N-acyltransferase [Microbacterium sp. SORGH_AS_0888]MDQ1128469.1 apolipoprotein N-acyltransferase [Microbacterium sp. SORGH_AS_0888]